MFPSACRNFSLGPLHCFLFAHRNTLCTVNQSHSPRIGAEDFGPCYSAPCHPASPCPSQPLVILVSVQVHGFKFPHMRETMEYLSLCTCFISLNLIFSCSVHLAANDRISFFYLELGLVSSPLDEVSFGFLCQLPHLCLLLISRSTGLPQLSPHAHALFVTVDPIPAFLVGLWAMSRAVSSCSFLYLQYLLSITWL